MVDAPAIFLKPFAENAGDPAFITYPLPVPSQIAILPGAASLTDGFPPLTMQDPASQGGVPPFGQDMNGILRMLSAYCVWLQAGMGFFFNTAFATANGGYPTGAQLQSTTNDALQWLNTVNGNMTDPDDAGTAVGWIALTAGGEYLSVAVAAGTTHNLSPVGFTPAVSYMDLDTTAGNATVDGIAGGFNGRKLIITNTGANLLTLAALTGSSSSNQFRLPSDFFVVQNQSVALEYVAGISKWIAP
jgi:hypothetical protein